LITGFSERPLAMLHPKKIAYAIIKTVSERLMAMFLPENIFGTTFQKIFPEPCSHVRSHVLIGAEKS
jgi:hypothetical protein